VKIISDQARLPSVISTNQKTDYHKPVEPLSLLLAKPGMSLAEDEIQFRSILEVSEFL
jgi:hypothetical protein